MKKNRLGTIALTLTLALAAAVSTVSGCGGGSISSLCEESCACFACKGNDLQRCKDINNKGSADADAAGCGSQFDDAVSCTAAHFSCQNSGDVGPFAPGCDAELAALAKCSKK